VLGLLLACATFAGHARAQVAQLSWKDDEAPELESEPPLPRDSIEGGLAYYGDDDGVSSLDLVLVELAGRYVLSPRWALSGHIGMALLSSAPERDPADLVFRPSNPELMLWYVSPLSAEGLSVRTGFGLAGPLTWIERGANARLHRTALANAAALDGLRRVWRWAPSRTSVIMAAELDADLDEQLLLHAELWSAFMIPSRDEFLSERLGLVIPASVAFIGRWDALRAGPRLHAVLSPSQTLDAVQFSVEPFVAVHVGRTFGEVAVTVNLDEPLAGPRGPDVWALHVRAGGEL
jgi:hypothetical protein